MEKKKHPILKGILIGTAIVLAILAIHFMRNYVIISHIAEKQAELENKLNYSYIIENESIPEQKVITKLYYKDGKKMQVIDGGENKKMIIWKDEQTKEEILIIPHALQAIISENEFKDSGIIPGFINDYIMSFTLGSFITSDILDGKECYKINWSGAKTYIDKSNGTVLRSENGKVISEGREYDSITIYRDWKFEELTDEDLSRPNLTGYEVKYNEK